jgi:hypothetical protein
METNTVITEKLVTMIAPDGNWQPMGTGEDMAQVIGFMDMLATAGIGQTYAQLNAKGFKIVPATITIEITGTEEDAFKQMKRK